MTEFEAEPQDHIKKSTDSWQKICKMQPALELEVLRRTAGLEANVIQEMEKGLGVKATRRPTFSHA